MRLGPHLEIVGVLIAARERVDLDEVAADGLRQRLEIGGGRDDADLVGGCGARGKHAEGDGAATDNVRIATTLVAMSQVSSLRTDGRGERPG